MKHSIPTMKAQTLWPVDFKSIQSAAEDMTEVLWVVQQFQPEDKLVFMNWLRRRMHRRALLKEFGKESSLTEAAARVLSGIIQEEENQKKKLLDEQYRQNLKSFCSERIIRGKKYLKRRILKEWYRAWTTQGSIKPLKMPSRALKFDYSFATAN